MLGLVRAEFLKLTSTRLWLGLLVGGILYTALSAAASAAFAGVDSGFGGESPGLDSVDALRNVYGYSAFGGAYLFAAILGVTAMTGEYRYQTITPTFLATPRRWPVVIAKFLANAAMGLAFGVAACLTAMLSGAIVVSIRGYGLGLDDGRVWSGMGLAVLAIALWSMIGVGVGTLIRNQIAAIIGLILIVFLVEQLLSFGLVAIDLDAVARLLPSMASSAMVSASTPITSLLDWWQGALAMLGYAGLFTGLGLALSVRRDVS
jgi:ABC-type transport system involved in multi-copper enzyme maturation permease subunit